MGFAESLENIVKPAAGPKCSVCTTVSGLPAADQKVIIAAFADPAIRTSDLRRVFLAEGYSFSTGTVGRHRRKECRR
jgi:hypothetical protein